MGTIHKHLQQWQGKASSDDAEAPELPESIATALMDFVATEIATACEPLADDLRQAKAAADELAEENARLEVVRDELKECLAEERQVNAVLSGKNAELQKLIIDLKLERDLALSDKNQVSKAIALLVEKNKELSALPVQLANTTEALKNAESSRQHAEQSAAVLSAKLDAADARSKDLAERLASAEKRNSAQEAEFKAAQATAQRATAELGSIARELAELKAQPVKVVKSSPKKTTPKKPANQELAV